MRMVCVYEDKSHMSSKVSCEQIKDEAGAGAYSIGFHNCSI